MIFTTHLSISKIWCSCVCVPEEEVWCNYNQATKKTQWQSGESVVHVTTYVAIQHLLLIVETQTHKRVTSAIKVNELRVNMEIFQNIGDSEGFAATSHPG